MALVLSETPAWWFDSWALADWLQTLFNQPVEVHTFELGALVGVLLATLVVRRRQRAALTVTLVVLLFTFGVFETSVLCSDVASACQHVRLKPWYFVGGFVAAHLFILGVVGLLSGPRAPPEEELQSLENPLSGVVVAVLLGLSLYSFVSAAPIHPVTGLATIGGFGGAILGLGAFEWASDERGRTFRQVLRSVRRGDVDDLALVVGYGTIFGFAYPRVFLELGLVLRGEWLFGVVTWAVGGMLSAVTYVFVLFLASLLLFGRRLRRRRDGAIDGQQFAALVLGYVVYTACLFVATAYANRLWYHLIPSASV